MVDLGFSALILRGPANLIDDVARVARAQFLLQRAMDEIDKSVCNGVVALDFSFCGDSAENLAEFLVADFPNKDLGLNSAQECCVQKLRRIEIRCEDNQHLKGHFDLASAGEREEVDLPIQEAPPSD